MHNIGQEARPAGAEGNSADTALLPLLSPAVTSPSNSDIQTSRTPLFSPAVATPASVNSGGSRTSINRRPTEAHLQDALAKCRAKIEQFRLKFDCVANWEGQVVIQSSQLDMQVDLIQKMALNFPTHLSETYEIRQILKEATAHWSKAAGISLVEDRSGQAPSSATQPTAPGARLTPGVQAPRVLTEPAPGASVGPGPPGPAAQGNLATGSVSQPALQGQQSSDGERQCITGTHTQAGLPDPNYQAELDSLHQLRRDYEATYTEIKAVIQAYDDHLIAPKDYEDLRDQVAQLQVQQSEKQNLANQVSHLQSELASQTTRMSVLEGKVSAATLMCKQYENIGKGVTTANLTLKTQLSSVQDRVDQCENQLHQVSRPPSRAQQVDSTDYSVLTGIQALGQQGQDLPNDPTSETQAQKSSQLPQPSLGTTKHVEVDLVNSPTSSIGSTDYLVPDSELSRPGKRLKREARRLEGALRPAVSATIPKSILQDIYKNTVTLVDETRKAVMESLATYELDKHCNDQLCDAVEEILDKAAEWTGGMRSMHRHLGYHKESLSKKLYTNLSPFTNTSEINVFEFFRRFELITGESGSLTEQAELLYNKYLDRTLQLELVTKRNDFQAMRKYLVQKYGILSVITDNILKSMEGGPIPPPAAPYLAQANYFRNLNSAIQRVDDLRRQECISTPALEKHIYSSEFLAKLLKHIPPIATNDFMDSLVKADEDVCMIEGPEAFRLLSSCVARHFKKFDSLTRVADSSLKATRSEKPSPKGKVPAPRSPIKSKLSSHSAARTTPGNSPKQGPRKNATSSTSNRTSKGFPCINTSHKHSLGACQDFFAMNASERLNAVHNASVKVCKTCLGSNMGCTISKCANFKDIPPVLLCRECKDIGKTLGKTPYCVLVCKNASHARPPVKDFTDALQKFYKGFNPAQHNVPVNMSAHINLVATSQVHMSAKPKSLSSKPTASRTTPAINTTTGNQVSVNDDKVISEAHEDIVYVLQILNLKGRDVLTFYDRGSNQNMISGPLAEDLKLKVVTQEPAAIGVVGGGRIWTEYGAYALRLGPTDSGHYHELTAQGIKEVTDTFPRYDLEEINHQVTETGQLQDGTVLPDYIGGTPAQLLIGLKDTQLEPWCVFQLPNGLGVYKSILKDKFGSNYCYGGPDRLFTAINKRTGGNINHFRVYLTQLVNQYKGSPYPMLSRALSQDLEDIGYGLDQYKTTTPVYSYQCGGKNTICPSSLTSIDFEELGNPVPVEPEACKSIVPGDNTARNRRWREKKDRREARNRMYYGLEYKSYQARKQEKSRHRTFNILNRYQDPPTGAQSDLHHIINCHHVAPRTSGGSANRSVPHQPGNCCDEDTPNLHQVVLEDEVESHPTSNQRSEKECAHPWRCLNNIACSTKDADGPSNEKQSESAREHKQKVTLPLLTSISNTSICHTALDKKLHQLHKSKGIGTSNKPTAKVGTYRPHQQPYG